MKRIPFRCLWIILLLAAAAPLLADGQSWSNNSLTFKLDSRWTLKFTTEARYNEITYQDAFLKNWQGGVVCKLPSDFYGAFLYKRETTNKIDFVLSENRFTFEGGWKTRLREKLDFDCRFRTEIRCYDDGLADDHLRFRFRIRLKTALTIGALKMKPFIATEPFGDTLADRINRNRFYIGTVLPLGDHAELVINYIRQDTRGRETIHILNSGFDLKF